MAGSFISSGILCSSSILILGLCELYYNSYSIVTNRRKLFKRGELLLKNIKVLFNGDNFILIYYLIIQIYGFITLRVTSTWHTSIFSGKYNGLEDSIWNFFNNILFCYIIVTLIYLLFSVFFLVKEENSQLLTVLLIKLPIIFNLLFYVNNLITLLLIIELIAVLYYFFFLNNIINKKQTIIKLKNLLINYLWLSLLTLLFFILAVVFIIYNIGTVNFSEIYLLNLYINNICYLFLFISISWKLGLPIFHFFKLEVYQFLSLNIIFYFSLFTLLINAYIFIFLGIKLPNMYISIDVYLLYLILILNIIYLYRGLDSLKFFQFLAISGLNTITLILIFIII